MFRGRSSDRAQDDVRVRCPIGRRGAALPRTAPARRERSRALPVAVEHGTGTSLPHRGYGLPKKRNPDIPLQAGDLRRVGQVEDPTYAGGKIQIPMNTHAFAWRRVVLTCRRCEYRSQVDKPGRGPGAPWTTCTWSSASVASAPPHSGASESSSGGGTDAAASV